MGSATRNDVMQTCVVSYERCESVCCRTSGGMLLDLVVLAWQVNDGIAGHKVLGACARVGCDPVS